MSENPVRRYDEKEVRWLLERTAELQNSPANVQKADGLTLSDLEAIAAEAGLDAGLLRRAARDLESSVPPGRAGMLGAPLRIAFERTLAGIIDEAAFAQLLPTVEAAAGGSGQVTQIGHTFTWHSRRMNSGRTMQVRVSSADDATTVRVEEHFGDLAGGLFGGVLGGVGGGVGIGAGSAIGIALHSVALAFALPAFVIGTTFFSVRAGFRRYVQKRHGVLQQLLEDIAAVVNQAGVEKRIEEKTVER